MSHPRVRLALLLATLVLAVAVAQATSVAAQDAARLELEPSTTASGSWIAVRGFGLPPGALVLVEVCGSHRNPALGCDDAAAVDAEVSQLGTIEVPLLVELPPAPCPCTVRVRGAAGDDEAVSAELDITDAPVTEEAIGEEARDPLATNDVIVSEVALEGDGPPAAWFGASPRRTFRYTLTNQGALVADGLEVELVAGDGDEAERLRAPEVGTLDPGEARDYEVTVDLGALHTGTYSVRGTLRGAGDDQRFEAETSSYPWMLVLIPAIVLLEVLLLVGRNWLRKAMARRAEAAEQAAAPDPELVETVASSVATRVQRTREVGVDTRALAGRVVAGVGASADRGGAPEAADDGDGGAPEDPPEAADEGDEGVAENEPGAAEDGDVDLAEDEAASSPAG